MSKKIDRSKLKEAIVLIDNETLKLRDRIKKTGESSDKIKRKKLYSLKDRVLYININDTNYKIFKAQWNLIFEKLLDLE